MIYLLGALVFSTCSIDSAPIASTVVDMTYTYDDGTQNYPTLKKFNMTVVMNGTHESGNWIQGEDIVTATHMGTHMDAQSHFVKGGMNVDQTPLTLLISPAAVINITAKAMENRNAAISVEDLESWEQTTGQSLDGTIVLLNSGWGKKWHNREEYIGTPEEDVTKLNFPGFSPEASQWLVDNRHVNGIGSDTMSFDTGNSTQFLSHKIFLGAGIFGLENVANVDKIPIYGATLHVMPMKIGQASGAPTRIIATYPKVIFD